jgi:hypothetical protein
MPAVSLLEELISGIEPIFVTPHDRQQSKHPISSTRRLKGGAHPLQGDRRNRVSKTWMPSGAVTNLLIVIKQV